MSAASSPQVETSVALAEFQRWYAVGERVAELAYLGRGHYEAHATTVTRVSKAMVFTADGRRFWRDGLLQVGARSRQLLVADALAFRLVPLDNPHATRLLADTPKG